MPEAPFEQVKPLGCGRPLIHAEVTLPCPFQRSSMQVSAACPVLVCNIEFVHGHAPGLCKVGHCGAVALDTAGLPRGSQMPAHQVLRVYVARTR